MRLIRLTIIPMLILLSNVTLAQYDDAITNDANIATYILEASVGDELVAEMYRVSGDLIPFMALADEDGNFVTRTIFGDNEQQAVIEYTFEVAGTYELYATRLDVEDGDTVGDYFLSITGVEDIDPAPASNVIPNRNASYLVFGDIYNITHVSGRVDESNIRIPYFMYLDGDHPTVVIAESTAGDLIPMLILRNGDGNVLQLGTSNSPTQSELSFEGIAAGWYIVEVTRFDEDKGLTSGNYTIRQLNITR